MLQNFGYYTFLGLSYALAIFLWAILYKSFAKNLYAVQDEPEKDKPWLDLGFLLLAGIATILIGQLYTAGQLLPELQWDNLKISECLNQIIIFSPFLLYFFLKKHPGHRLIFIIESEAAFSGNPLRCL